MLEKSQIKKFEEFILNIIFKIDKQEELINPHHVAERFFKVLFNISLNSYKELDTHYLEYFERVINKYGVVVSDYIRIKKISKHTLYTQITTADLHILQDRLFSEAELRSWIDDLILQTIQSIDEIDPKQLPFLTLCTSHQIYSFSEQLVLLSQKDGRTIEDQTPFAWAIFNEVKIELVKPIEWCARNNIQVDGLTVDEWLVRKIKEGHNQFLLPAANRKLKIDGVSATLYALKHDIKQQGFPTVAVFVDSQTTIEGIEAIAWCAINKKKIKGSDPIVYALNHNIEIMGQHPIKWALLNNVAVQRTNPMIWAFQHGIKDIFSDHILQMYNDPFYDTSRTIIKFLESKLPKAESEFHTVSEKKTGRRTAGYVAEDSTKQQHMIKISTKKKIDPDFLNEFVTSALFERLLYSRAPVVGLITSSKEGSILLRSKYLCEFVSFYTFVNSTNIPIQEVTSFLSNIKGIEKLIVTSLALGNCDFHGDNIGIFQDSNDETQLGLIDFGLAGTTFFSSSAIMWTYLAKMIQILQYDKFFNINLKSFIEAIKEVCSLETCELETLIKNRLHILHREGFNLTKIPLYYIHNKARLPEKLSGCVTDNKDSYTKHLVTSIKMNFQTCLDLGNNLSKLLIHDAPYEWVDGGWFKAIRNFDLIEYCINLEKELEQSPNRKSTWRNKITTPSRSKDLTDRWF